MKKILYFSASWCGPCQNFKPIMESISSTLPVTFVDIDSRPDLVSQYGIRSVPTLVFVDGNGNELSKKVGVLSEGQVRDAFNQL